MKAFITGATGFIGTHVVKMLAQEGWELVILKRSVSDISEFKHLSKIEYVIGDITDKTSLDQGIPDDVDVVYHIAGSVAHMPHHLEKSRYSVNVDGTRHMVDVCLQKNVPKFIYTSTVLVYDFHGEKYFNESAPLNYWSKDAYIQSKRMAEEEVSKGIQQGLKAIIMQPSAVFGSYDKATWSKMFIEVDRGLPFSCTPPGGCSASYVRNVAAAHVQAFHKGKVGSKYILGGPDVSLKEILQEVARLRNKKLPRWALPPFIFKMYGWAEYYASTYLLRRDPMLTPHTINILCETVLMDSSRAIRELDYELGSLKEMLVDCHQWMIKTRRLPPITNSEGRLVSAKS